MNYKLIKHRGIHNKNIKENTYTAIKEALKSNKYIGVEFDVRCTKDNVFIVYHNAHIDGKLIKNMNYIELPKYIPKFKDILKINSNKIFLIEIKDLNNNYDEFIKILNKYQNKNLYVMSFSTNMIEKININNRLYKIGILNYVLNTNEYTKKLDFICILNSLLNDNIMHILNDYEVFSYGIFENKKYKSVTYIVDE